MNYMEQVAQMLGVELYEEFEIAGYISKYRFTKWGLEYFDEPDKRWIISDSLYGVLNGTYEIKKPILDNAEKEYLSHIIKPFRDSIKFISKYGLSNCEYIDIVYYDKLIEKESSMFFPSFGKREMYKGMETNREYVLEELGL